MFEWSVPEGSMFVWMTARQPGLNSPSVCIGGGRILRARKWVRPRGLVSPSLRLNFTASPPDILQEGVRRLIRAAREFAALQVAAN
jgi:2-aminoadipate transaminase